MKRGVVGLRIRERRRAVGLKQVELAALMGVSPSYLNLIERNKRNIAGPLLVSAASALGLRLQDLDDQQDQALAGRLTEIAADPEMLDHGADVAAAAELLGRFPGWARLIDRLGRGYRDRTAEVRALSDRLAHDPVLADTVHAMLTNIAAIRSASEILSDDAGLTEGQKARFLAILNEETVRLTAVAERLAAFFDAPAPEQAPVAATAEDAFRSARNRFAALEPPADDAPWDEARLRDAVSGRVAAADAGDFAAYDPAMRRLSLPEGAPGPSRRGALALAAADVLYAGPLAEAAPAVRPALLQYAADALLAPQGAYLAAGAALDWDLDAMAARFGADFAAMARRLTTLRGAGAPGGGVVAVNRAGAVVLRRDPVGLRFAGVGDPCGLWPHYEALAAPDRVLCRAARFPDGARVVFVAKGATEPAARFGPAPRVTATLVCLPAAEAARTVYARTLDLAPDPVGPACRICPRDACAHRSEAPVFG